MSARITPKTETVACCVARQDGSWMVVTRKGQSAVSKSKIPEGVPIIIQDGRAVRTTK